MDVDRLDVASVPKSVSRKPLAQQALDRQVNLSRLGGTQHIERDSKEIYDRFAGGDRYPKLVKV